MKLLVYCSIIFILASSAACATITVSEAFPICTDTDGQSQPAISGDTVVWMDYRNGNVDIFGYSLATHEEFPICTNSGSQGQPKISGDTVVWMDGGPDIFGYNLATREEFPICTNSVGQFEPEISGNMVVWDECDVNGSWNNNEDIHGYNLTTHETFSICTRTGDQAEPAISGDTVVWADFRNFSPGMQGYPDIYGYNLATHEEFPICTNTHEQWYPAISGNTVVWQDNRNGNQDIYGYNLATHEEFPICTNTTDQYQPAISGNTVVWQDNRNGNQDIYGYNLATHEEFPICTNTTDQYQPAISGNTVVWCDGRNGNGDIYGATIEYGTPPPPQPKTYGVFVGSNDYLIDVWGVRLFAKVNGQADAANVRGKFEDFASWGGGMTLSYDVSATDGDPSGDIFAALESYTNTVKSGDNFVFFYSGHGYGLKSLTSDVDESLYVTEGTTGNIWDDALATWFLDPVRANKWRDVNKVFLLDSCFSGGFWDGENADLSALDNVYLIAAADEHSTAAGGYLGSPFSNTLAKGLTKSDGSLRADQNRDGVLSMQELSLWLQNYPDYQNGVEGYIKGDWSDEIISMPWNVDFESNGESGFGIVATVPEPGTMAMIVPALLGFAGMAWRKMRW